MCKLAKIASQIGLITLLASIAVMVTGYLTLNITFCVTAMVLMSISALAFIVCTVCSRFSKTEETV
jgi:hypothetical protein